MMTNTTNDRPQRVASASELFTRYATGERNFRGADLSGADLRWANLRWANLSGANLQAIKDDLFGYLDHVPLEVPGLLAVLETGKIDGSTYSGPCACLAGTCEKLAVGVFIDSEDVASDKTDRATELLDLRDVSSPRERWFLAIRPGDTPTNSTIAAITAEWLREWIAAHPASEDAPEREVSDGD